MKLNRTPNPLDRNARNGENDNWEKIEGSIKRIDDTVSDLILESGGDSNLEVVQARGGKPVLNDRLNSIDENINRTKADLDEQKGDLIEKVNDVREGLENKRDKYVEIGMADLDQEVKESFTGGSVAVVGVNAVGNINVKNKAISYEKTNFIARGKNIYNKDDIVYGKVLTNTGVENDSSVGHSSSNFIPVEPNTNYVKLLEDAPTQVVFYRTENEVISGGPFPKTFKTPANCNLIRFNINKDIVDEQMIEKGTESTEYEPYKLRLMYDDKTNTIEEGSITYEKTDFVVKSKNLFNKDDINEGYVVHSNGELVQSSAGHSSSGFIEVSPNTDYVINLDVSPKRIAQFDENFNYIKRDDGVVNFKTDDKTKYVMFNLNKDYIDMMQLEEGAVSTPFEPFGYKFKYDASKRTGITTNDVIAIRYSLSTNTSLCERLDDLNTNNLDSLYPFSDIKLCNVQKTEWGATKITYADETGFKRDGSNGEVMVEIPKHYFKRYRKDGYEYLEVSGVPKDGFVVDPAFVENGKEINAIYVSAYDGYVDNDKLRSVSGVHPTSGVSLTDLRQLAKNNGVGFGLLDYRTVAMLQRLFMVYFANRDSQSVVGGGFTQLHYQSFSSTRAINNGFGNYIEVNTGPHAQRQFLVGDSVTVSDETWQFQNRTITDVENINGNIFGITFSGDPVEVFEGETRIYHIPQKTGQTDSMSKHTGSANIYGVDGHDAVKLFHIENLWGNVWSLLDGIILDNLVAYVGEDMSNYTSSADFENVYKPLAYKFPEQSDNTQDRDTEFGFFVKNLVLDSLNPSYQLPIELGTTNENSSFADPWYAHNREKQIPSYGGGWDLWFRAGIFTTRFWYTTEQEQLLNGGRLIFKDV